MMGLRVRIIDLNQIRSVLVYPEIISRMRDALIAQSWGDCETPMPMHLDIAAERAEIHMKSSYRRGGKYFALKIASTFPGNPTRGLSTGNGMMLLSSAQTGEPVAFLADGGHLTDVRTAAASAMVARELGRKDDVIGILGTGIQARLQAQMHAEVLGLCGIWLWGRTRERALECRRDLETLLPGCEVRVAGSPSEVALHSRLIVTATASRSPLLFVDDIEPGTHISAVGSDSQGKQELHAEILRQAALLLVDSRSQCEKLGELQHARSERERAAEIGRFCEAPRDWATAGISVADFTGLGVEDLYIAEYCYERV
ncbi:MAG TPA: ornithine cyclodeaminase family protein [Bryobacteraceae bacterium]|nr:ornithine cyclodeaminase family protein [Bryobacteraceae bacterium]